MSNIAIIGECMIEISHQGTPLSDQIQQKYGGDTLNTAIYLSRLLPQNDIFYITALGKDVMSQKMLLEWQKEGIKTEHTLHFEHLSPGLYWIILDAMGERSFLYWRKNSAASQWLKHPDINTTLEALMAMDWIYLSGITLAILEDSDREKLLSWLETYQKQGGNIAYDSNYRASLWSDRSIALQAHQRMLTMADIALLTDEDEISLWELPKNELQAHLFTLNIPLLILKQGKKGALISRPHHAPILVPSFVIDKVVDTTAAGDAFNAGFLAAYIQKNSPEKACIQGHKLASVVIQHAGAIIPLHTMPTWQNDSVTRS